MQPDEVGRGPPTLMRSAGPPAASNNQQLIQLGPHFNYAPLRSPMRTSKPFVPNSETSETLVDVPILITTCGPDLHEEKVPEKTKKFSLPLENRVIIFLFNVIQVLVFTG